MTHFDFAKVAEAFEEHVDGLLVALDCAASEQSIPAHRGIVERRLQVQRSASFEAEQVCFAARRQQGIGRIQSGRKRLNCVASSAQHPEGYLRLISTLIFNDDKNVAFEKLQTRIEPREPRFEFLDPLRYLVFCLPVIKELF